MAVLVSMLYRYTVTGVILQDMSVSALNWRVNEYF